MSADANYFGGKLIELKKITEEALKDTPTIEHAVVVRRLELGVNVQEGRKGRRYRHSMGCHLFALSQRKAIVFIGALDDKAERAIEIERSEIICINLQHNRLLAARTQGCNGLFEDLATVTAPAILRAHEKPINAQFSRHLFHAQRHHRLGAADALASICSDIEALVRSLKGSQEMLARSFFAVAKIGGQDHGELLQVIQ